MPAKKVNTVVEEDVAVEAVAPKTEAKKKFADDDMIECVSITTGELFVVGPKTGTLYDWKQLGMIDEMEYKDLLALVRARHKSVYTPRFIIQNEAFLEQHKDIKKLYDSLYKIGDLKRVLTYSPAQLKKVLPTLPVGAQESIKSLAMSGVNDGSLDSVKAIRVLDEFFGTDMLLKLR